jgi:hypothetical protein
MHLAAPILLLRRRPLVAVLLAMCLLGGVWAGTRFASGVIGFRAFSAQVQALEGSDDADLGHVSWTFPFRASRVTVSAGIGQDELASAESVDTGLVFRSEGWLRDLYVSDLISRQADSDFIERLGADLDDTADALGLDDDGRLELMVTAVQAIPYGEIDRQIRLPVEVVAYRSGVCTEKTVLLGALMLRDGWDTCVWVFDSQRHVAIGVGGDAATFRDSGYVFIETTGPAYVGQAAAGYRSCGPIADPPQTIHVGGDRAYGSGDQIAYILGILEIAERGSRRLEPYGEYAEDTAGALGQRYRRYANVAERAGVLADYIEQNTHDRPAVYERLRREAGLRELGAALTWER